tara:strand:+ start:106 stop:540 length:435 start_codon:yes stop_codon:yes gene_type:complete
MTYIQRDHLYDALSPKLLAQEPQSFLENVQLCIDEAIGIQNYINDAGKMNTWFSPLPICLYYLVGDLKEHPAAEFYGSNTVISDDMGVEIMKLLLVAGANLNITNYYGNTIFDEIQNARHGKYSLTARRNNKKLIKFLKTIQTT